MFPLILTDLPVDELLDALGEATGAPFRRLPEGQDWIDPRADGEPVAAGSTGGVTYLLDLNGVVFYWMLGALARVAAARGCLVVRAGYDPVEQQCDFFAARGPRLLRLFWSNDHRATAPYSEGERLPTEETHPLSAWGGAGLIAALKHFGLPGVDSLADIEELPRDVLAGWKGDGQALADSDELGRRINQHVREHMRPFYTGPQIGLDISIRPAEEASRPGRLEEDGGH